MYYLLYYEPLKTDFSFYPFPKLPSNTQIVFNNCLITPNLDTYVPLTFIPAYYSGFITVLELI